MENVNINQKLVRTKTKILVNVVLVVLLLLSKPYIASADELSTENENIIDNIVLREEYTENHLVIEKENDVVQPSNWTDHMTYETGTDIFTLIAINIHYDLVFADPKLRLHYKLELNKLHPWSTLPPLKTPQGSILVDEGLNLLLFEPMEGFATEVFPDGQSYDQTKMQIRFYFQSGEPYEMEMDTKIQVTSYYVTNGNNDISLDDTMIADSVPNRFSSDDTWIKSKTGDGYILLPEELFTEMDMDAKFTFEMDVLRQFPNNQDIVEIKVGTKSVKEKLNQEMNTSISITIESELQLANKFEVSTKGAAMNIEIKSIRILIIQYTDGLLTYLGETLPEGAVVIPLIFFVITPLYYYRIMKRRYLYALDEY